MGVDRAVVGAMANDHHIAKTALNASKLDHAITDRQGRCACGCGIVNTVVFPHRVEDGVQTHAHAAGLA